MFSAVKEHLVVLALGPAQPIPRGHCLDAVNIYSSQDGITGLFGASAYCLDRLGEIAEWAGLYKNKSSDIRFVPCCSTWKERSLYIADHAFLGGTYQGVKKEQFDYYKVFMDFVRGQMINLIFLFVFIFCSSFNFFTGKSKTQEYVQPDYVKYEHQIVAQFVKEAEKECNLVCVGTGGSMPYNVEKIDIMFYAYRPATIEQARELEVALTEKLLKLVNSHEKIRPFLNVYPFTSEYLHLSVNFKDRHGKRYKEGIDSVLRGRDDKIFYKKEEEYTYWGGGVIGNNGEIKRENSECTDTRFVTLHSESYLEALKIVQDQHKTLLK